MKPPTIDSTGPQVLHIVEALGGGVMAALRDYIDNTRDGARHMVLASRRAGHDTGDFDGIEVLDLNWDLRSLAAFKRVVHTIRSVKPDVIHLHSSWAGLIGRILPIARRRIIYTPHCFAFERQDVGTFARWLFLLVEFLLAGRSAAVVAVSPREADLARRLRPGHPTFYVPNVVGIDGSCAIRRPDSFVIAGAGRISSQKDPQWFAEFALALGHLRPDVSFVWLGAGDPHLEACLRDAGVDVTGWIRRRDLLERLSRSSLYVHSAAWEGAPMSVLEAANVGVPVIGRDIPALRSIALPNLFAEPRGAALFIDETLRAGRMRSLREQSMEWGQTFKPAWQRAELMRAYVEVISGVPRAHARDDAIPLPAGPLTPLDESMPVVGVPHQRSGSSGAGILN
jgi:glycosyltransferase involved in cell wall biosynthesis